MQQTIAGELILAEVKEEPLSPQTSETPPSQPQPGGGDAERETDDDLRPLDSEAAEFSTPGRGDSASYAEGGADETQPRGQSKDAKVGEGEDADGGTAGQRKSVDGSATSRNAGVSALVSLATPVNLLRRNHAHNGHLTSMLVPGGISFNLNFVLLI